MNKYEKVFMDIQSIFTDKGIYIQDSDVRIGYSYIELEFNDDLVTAYPENEDLFMNYPVEVNDISELFKRNDVKFVVTQDKAEETKFMSWKEFCDEIDNADKIERKYNLDIFSI